LFLLFKTLSVCVKVPFREPTHQIRDSIKEDSLLFYECFFC